MVMVLSRERVLTLSKSLKEKIGQWYLATLVLNGL